jgi:hypothetical protein
MILVDPILTLGIFLFAAAVSRISQCDQGFGHFLKIELNHLTALSTPAEACFLGYFPGPSLAITRKNGSKNVFQ